MKTIALALTSAASNACDVGGGIFHDMHDGDMKQMVVDGGSLIIKPYNNKEKWVVNAAFDADCTASIDFHVPGKPAYPPVNLTATLWGMTSFTGTSKVGVVFTDPTGTIADASTPLNMWLEPNTKATTSAAAEARRAAPCLVTKAGHGTVFDDMHDGDQKDVSDVVAAAGAKESMHIIPYGNNQTWTVVAPFDEQDCTALVNFNVPGKPGPPPVSLTATPWKMQNGAGQSKQTIEFTDPTSTIAPPTTPLNGWVEVIERA